MSELVKKHEPNQGAHTGRPAGGMPSEMRELFRQAAADENPRAVRSLNGLDLGAVRAAAIQTDWSDSTRAADDLLQHVHLGLQHGIDSSRRRALWPENAAEKNGAGRDRRECGGGQIKERE